ncbi:MAG: hypothetical protein [Podoviridae sp. ctviO18]|nr:MAG: hypothetical protein [Podoviridae sp. ctviO18]
MWRVRFDIQLDQAIQSIETKETKTKRLLLSSREYLNEDGILTKQVEVTFNNKPDADKLFQGIKTLMINKSLKGNVSIHNCSHSEGEKNISSCDDNSLEYFNL